MSSSANLSTATPSRWRRFHHYRRPGRWIGVGLALLAGLYHLVGAAYTMECIFNRYRVPTVCKVMVTSKEFSGFTEVEVDYWTYTGTAVLLFGTAIGLAVAPSLARLVRKLLRAIGISRR
jgi:hypothetical protein